MSEAASTVPGLEQVLPRVRHWKQRFHRDADFVWLAAVPIGRLPSGNLDRSVPGTRVDKARFGPKLAALWVARKIALAEGATGASVAVQGPSAAEGSSVPAPVPIGVQAAPAAPSEPLPAGITQLGGGWYDVEAGGAIHRVRGREAAEALLRGEPPPSA